MGGIRLIPIVLFATASLLALKVAGIVAGSGYTLGGLAGAQAQVHAIPPPQPLDGASPAAPAQSAQPRQQQKSWAQEFLGYPDITGSVSGGAKAPNAVPAATPSPVPPPASGRPGTGLTPGTPVALDERPQLFTGERAILERLQERRQELEARSRELDIREGLLRAAEKRLEARLDELKRSEAQSGGGAQKEADAARLKSLVTMYENMKAKEAARIFDRLDMRVLVDVALKLNPRRMSEIMAQMSPEAAERLTVELAARGGARQPSAADLPKIEGRPRS